MSPERWQRVNQLFHDARALAMEERAAFLDDACADDEALRRELLAMLAAAQANDHQFSALIWEQAARAMAGEPPSGAATPVLSLVGESVGHCRILSLLGKGGMGEVWLAEDTQLNRKVAVKLLPAEFTTQPERVRRFAQEERAASALNHPNIITIHEIGQAEGTHYIVTEYVAGETLRQRLASAPQGRIELAEAIDIALQIAAALAAAHEAGITHRDIKPENVMMRRDGIVKVLDFGLSKLLARDEGGGMRDERRKDEGGVTKDEKNKPHPSSLIPHPSTNPGVVMGTPRYMSPEQARGAKVDTRTDIFSLGVVLYEMVTGRAPFEGETASDVIAAILKTEPPPLSDGMREVPGKLEHIVSRALRKDREERYQDAKDLLVDLKDLKQELELEARAVKQIQTPRPILRAAHVTGEVRKHNLGFAVALSVLLLAAMGLGYWYFASRASHSAPIESIAVLPFQNASGNAEVEYLSDGISESLINSLSQLPRLSVKARSSVFRYKGKEIEPQQVGSELSVQAVLNGRVVQRGDNLTLSLELVDARNGNQLWGKQYPRKLTDLVSLQSEMARDVSEKLRLRLTSTEQQRLTKQGTENTAAYQAYLKGQYFWNRSFAPGFEKSREYFQQAIDLDSTYALAYSGLAHYYAFASSIGLLPPNENWPKAEAAANKALALDDTLAEAYNALADIKLNYYRDWPSAERYFRRGIELNPDYAEMRNHYALSLAFFGRGEEALAEVQRAVELEPLSLRFNLYWAYILFNLRQYDRAINQFRKTLELDPNFAVAHEWLGDAFEQKGMHREAIAEWGKALTLSGAGEWASNLERTYAASGFEDAVRALAQQRLEKLNERVKHGEYVPAFEYLNAYIRLGDKEQAFAWLDKALPERQAVWIIKVNPIYDGLRNDPRFQNVLRRAGLTP